MLGHVLYARDTLVVAILALISFGCLKLHFWLHRVIKKWLGL